MGKAAAAGLGNKTEEEALREGTTAALERRRARLDAEGPTGTPQDGDGAVAKGLSDDKTETESKAEDSQYGGGSKSRGQTSRAESIDSTLQALSHHLERAFFPQAQAHERSMDTDESLTYSNVNGGNHQTSKSNSKVNTDEPSKSKDNSPTAAGSLATGSATASATITNDGLLP